MKKILIFVANLLLCTGVAGAAVRDGTAISREKSSGQVVQSRVATSVPRTSVRTGNLIPRNATSTARAASAGKQVSARATATQKRVAGVQNNARSGQMVVSRASSSGALMSETRTGAEYEQCKNAYFSCMDQFCSLKNDDYRRCSCNDRVFELTQLRETLQGAGEDLTVFNENLDVVGMTAAQATAMRTESDGEHALTSDNSASKALLQAIMNSIRGTDASVGGKYSDLNSVSLSFDTANAFGMTDIGQAIGGYNGQALYSAVYPQCRQAVRNDCSDAALQRAITAYLMAVEQDCNTVQSAIAETQKQMKAAVRESNAMLDLARIENRQKHNSSDITTCINEVETAILSEEVCGANYHKCLDNGEYIDITTGQPIAGVSDFYKLEKMLSFSEGVEMSNQKLSKITNNRMFVQNFENRVKKFAQPALDKCVEKSDVVWSEYLDKAMLSIFYAQRAKVAEIKKGCFDYVSSCYMNTEKAIDAAMDELGADNIVVLQPNKVALNSQVCSDYIESCNNMFDQDIIASYIQEIQDEDTLTACRAVVQQCFDKYGGTNYENFYYPYSGLFKPGEAPDWFSLYEITGFASDGTPIKEYKSECAKQLTTIDACNDPDMIERAFGGFDRIDNVAWVQPEGAYPVFFVPTKAVTDGICTYTPRGHIYGMWNDITDWASNVVDSVTKAIDPYANCLKKEEGTSPDSVSNNLYVDKMILHRNLRPTGVATEVYNNVLSGLVTQCTNLYGRFMPWQLVNPVLYDIDNNLCLMISVKKEENSNSGRLAPTISSVPGSAVQREMNNYYQIGTKEDMCPRDYADGVDTLSWGMCSCWENGARRSKWGTTTRCQAVLPTTRAGAKDSTCVIKFENAEANGDTVYDYIVEKPITREFSPDDWCTVPANLISELYGSVCPLPKENDYQVKDKPGEYCGVIRGNETEHLYSLPHSIDSDK